MSWKGRYKYRNNYNNYNSKNKPLNVLNDYEINGAPKDSISQLAWHPSKNILAASSWDNSVSVYQVQQEGNKFRAKGSLRMKHDGPALCCQISKGNKLYSGGCDNQAKITFFQNGKTLTFGKHDSCIPSLHFIEQLPGVVTTSWDKSFKIWDLRKKKMACKTALPERVYCSSMRNQYLLLGLGGGKRPILLFDVRKPTKPVFAQESPLKMITRTISLFPNAKGYAIGSIEGRVGIEKFGDKPDFQGKRKYSFAFKCHREGKNKNNLNNIFPINDISFHVKPGLFSTVGANGRFHFWDMFERRRTFQLTKRYQCSLTCGQFNGNGRIFAIGVGYDFTLGTSTKLFNNNFGSKILLHAVKKNEVTFS